MLYQGETLQSQYSTSATIKALVESARVRIAPDADIDLFYRNIFDVETAQGIGLDIWGRIVGVGRYLDITGIDDVFGFQEGVDWQPFDQAPFWDGKNQTQQVMLGDEAYRQLIMWKALANISTADAATLNNLLTVLFDGKEVVVREVGPMAIELYVYFELAPFERAILQQYGLFAKGAGVGFEWCEIATPVFGFGEGIDWEPFDQAPFWNGQNYINQGG